MKPKTLLINGASKGIGAEMVRLFSKNDYNVAFTYKKSDKEAAELAKELNALAIKADSANEADVISAVKQTIDTFGSIDVLINNAAISSFSLFTDISAQEWKNIFDINVHGAFYYTREASREMIKKKHGRIINISSIWGVSGASCEVHYSATKAALIGMTKALAKELGPSGITVNCIAPGVIDTEMNSKLSADDIRSLIDETPMCRIGSTSDVANAALFLADDKASFITGQVLTVDGGFIV
jgi:3-oxoacyl-[acyl-carrier protein] reductase